MRGEFNVDWVTLIHWAIGVIWPFSLLGTRAKAVKARIQQPTMKWIEKKHYRVTGQSNKTHMNKQNENKLLILPKCIYLNKSWKDYLPILQIEQNANYTDSNSPNFIYMICSMNRFELNKKHIVKWIWICSIEQSTILRRMIIIIGPSHNESKPQKIQPIGMRETR